MSRRLSLLPLDALLLLAILFPATFLRGAYYSAHDFVLPGEAIVIFRSLAYVLGVTYLLVAYVGKPENTAGRSIILSLLIATLVIAPTLTSMGLRALSGDPVGFVHDNPIQVEEAAKFVLRGVNPYAANYFETPMARWPYTGPMYSNDPFDRLPDNWDVNPALYHVVSLPFGILATVPLQALFGATIGWFDARILYLLAYLFTLWLVNGLIDDPIKRLSALIVVGLNPLLISFLIEGRNDILVFSLVLGSAVAWHRGRLDLSGVLLGLAITTKHIAILFLPFYALLGWSMALPWLRRLVALGRHLAPTGIAALLVIIPFLAWDPAAFYEDVFGYLAGTIATSYPMAGIGLTGVAVFFGWVPNATVAFPTVALQAIFGGPVLVALLWRQWRTNTIQSALAAYGLFLLVYMWFARFYFDNYVGYIILVLSLAAFWPTQETSSQVEAA